MRHEFWGWNHYAVLLGDRCDAHHYGRAQHDLTRSLRYYTLSRAKTLSVLGQWQNLFMSRPKNQRTTSSTSLMMPILTGRYFPGRIWRFLQLEPGRLDRTTRAPRPPRRSVFLRAKPNCHCVSRAHSQTCGRSRWYWTARPDRCSTELKFIQARSLSMHLARHTTESMAGTSRLFALLSAMKFLPNISDDSIHNFGLQCIGIGLCLSYLPTTTGNHCALCGGCSDYSV